jgi:hypothetical protein
MLSRDFLYQQNVALIALALFALLLVARKRRPLAGNRKIQNEVLSCN